MELDLKMIVLGIILVVVLLILYNTFTTVPVSKNTAKKLGKKNKEIEYKELANPTSPNYYMSTWLYVENLQNTGDQTLYTISQTGNTSKIVEVLLKANGQLVYILNGSNDDNIVLPSFPIQQWCCFVLSVDSNSVVDSYINGKLVKSQQLESNINAITKDHKIIQGDLLANNTIYIAKFNRIPKTIDPETAWKEYQDGNGGGFLSKMFSSYGLSLRLTNEGNVHSSVGFPRGGVNLGDMSLTSNEDE
jgi:hypothetical protein